MTREDESMMLSTGKTVREELREILGDYQSDVRYDFSTMDLEEKYIDAIERVVALWMEEYVFPNWTA